jgi:hypothetical protein
MGQAAITTTHHNTQAAIAWPGLDTPNLSLTLASSLCSVLRQYVVLEGWTFGWLAGCKWGGWAFGVANCSNQGNCQYARAMPGHVCHVQSYAHNIRVTYLLYTYYSISTEIQWEQIFSPQARHVPSVRTYIFVNQLPHTQKPGSPKVFHASRNTSIGPELFTQDNLSPY